MQIWNKTKIEIVINDDLDPGLSNYESGNESDNDTESDNEPTNE